MLTREDPKPRLRLLAPCDLHERRPWYDWILREAGKGDWDLIVIAGDFLDQLSMRRSRAEQIAYHLDWFDAMAATGQLWAFCSGNHDENDQPLVIMTQDRLPKSLTQAFQAERWMDFARALGVAVDNENSLLRTAGGPVLVTAVPWRFGRETLSLRRPHPDDVSLVRTGREMSATARCPWVLLAHDPPAPSMVSTNKDENATRILVRAFQPDICVSGYLTKPRLPRLATLL